jgi:hypothetical protein
MSHPATLRWVSATERSITTIMIVAAIIAWLVVAAVFSLVSPVGSASAQLVGAISLGIAVGLTLWPLLWSVNRTAAGSLTTSARRSGLVGLVITIFIILRAIDVIQLPVVIFLVVGAVLVEAAVSLRR